MYTVATDICSVLPLAVKGIELIIYGSRKHYSHVTDVASMYERNKTFQYANTWTSMCSMKPFVRRRGVCFLQGAVVLMLLGISLELLIRAVLSRKVKAHTWSGYVVLDEEEVVKSFHMPQ